MSNIEKLKSDLGSIKMEDNPALVKQKSRDFYWYSPILKRQLDDVCAELIVTPCNEAEVLQTLKCCHQHGIPVTPRGSGTGNYGQAMPLAGGVVLNLAEMNRVKEIKDGYYIAEPGAVIADIDKELQPSNQEVRFHPSTYATASIGGFIAGGSAGIGSINYGTLSDPDNIRRLHLVTMEEEPRVLDITGEDVQKVAHAYGTNGIITEVEMPTAPRHDWVDVLVGFDDFTRCLNYGDNLANRDDILTKNVAPIAAPIPESYFLRHNKFIRKGQSVCLVIVAEQDIAAFESLSKREAGDILYRSDKAPDTLRHALPPVSELTWNHTTLRALRVDPTITYLQTLYASHKVIECASRMAEIFGDEVPGHLEYVRIGDKMAAFGLPLVRFTSEERLEEIVRIHEEEGCPVFNPHRYTLEEGGMKETNLYQLDFKKQADPCGLLNPGKMVGWENPDFDFSRNTYLFPGLSS